MFQSRLVLGFVFFAVSSSWMALAHPAPMGVEKLRRALLSMSDHELFLAASSKEKLSDGNSWSKAGACLQNDASKCESCACTSYTQTNYRNPTGYNGLPYSPTVPGTGCASLKYSSPDEITCWPGWSELGLCPAGNRGLEKLVANQMRLALRNSRVDVCKLNEYILLANLQDDEPSKQAVAEQEPDPAPVKTAAPPVAPGSGGLAVSPAHVEQPAAPKVTVIEAPAPSVPVQPKPAPAPQAPGKGSVLVTAAPPSAPAAPQVPAGPLKAVRSGYVKIQDLNGFGPKSPVVCGIVFVGPSGLQGMFPLQAQKCAGAVGSLDSRGVIDRKQAEMMIRQGSFSDRSLRIADQQCNAGLGSYREYISSLGNALSKSRVDPTVVSNLLALLEDTVNREKDSVRACVDRSFKASN